MTTGGMTNFLGTRVPIVAAPMAGGPTTVALALAVAEAGGFPFLAGGYKTIEALGAEISQVRAAGAEFGVNLFVPSRESVDEASFAAYAAELQPEADAHGVELSPIPVADDDLWDEKIALLVADPVPVVSFTFGLPDADAVARLQQVGSRVLASITTPDEAVAADALGVDGLVVQGPDAGGHSATHRPDRVPEPVALVDLVTQVRAASALPIVAAGGVDGPGSVRRLLAAGAAAVAVATLLLRADEAGTSATHRAALADPAFTETVITRVFTGRLARALRNGSIDRHDATAPMAYPAVHHLTRALRQAAGRAGDTDRLNLWAGTGYRSAREGPVSDIIEWLASSA